MRVLAILFLIFAIGCNSQFEHLDPVANLNTKANKEISVEEFEANTNFDEEYADFKDLELPTLPYEKDPTLDPTLPAPGIDFNFDFQDPRTDDPKVNSQPLKCPKASDTTVKPAIGIGSVYYLPFYKERSACEKDEMALMKDPEGNVLARMCKREIENCAMQGSCYYASKKGTQLFSYNRTVKVLNPKTKKEVTQYRFKINTLLTRCPSGMGPRNTCLDPYRSIAADLKFHKRGDVVYIPKMCGLKLPNGETHDGYFVVRDIGNRILGAGRFDFFIGFDNFENHLFTRMNLADVKQSRFEYFRVPETVAAKVRNARAFPIVPPSVQVYASNKMKESIMTSASALIAQKTQYFFQAKWGAR